MLIFRPAQHTNRLNQSVASLTHAALSEAHPQETQHRRPPSRRSPDGADRSTPQMVQLLRYPSLPPLMAAEAPPALLTPHGHVRSQPAKTASLRTSLSGEPSQFRKSSHLCEPLHLCSSVGQQHQHHPPARSGGRHRPLKPATDTHPALTCGPSDPQLPTAGNPFTEFPSREGREGEGGGCGSSPNSGG